VSGSAVTRKRVLALRSLQTPAPGKSSEDVFAVWPPSHGLALCDGASDSFAAADWARIVARGFARAGWWQGGFLRQRIEEYRRLFRGREMSWYERAAFERGSYTTLLGARLGAMGNYVDVLAIGDGLAVLLRDGQVARTFPFREPSEYDRDPVLISTIPEANRVLRERNGALQATRWTFAGGHRWEVLLMTDALGVWFLRGHCTGNHPERDLGVLNRESFAPWVRERQGRGELRRDDCTLCMGVLR
jgi:hypothetical protein